MKTFFNEHFFEFRKVTVCVYVKENTRETIYNFNHNQNLYLTRGTVYSIYLKLILYFQHQLRKTTQLALSASTTQPFLFVFPHQHLATATFLIFETNTTEPPIYEFLLERLAAPPKKWLACEKS